MTMGRWMRRYSEAGKREMDFADASLCWLATQTGVTDADRVAYGLHVNRHDFA
jgi:hypothetical protein